MAKKFRKLTLNGINWNKYHLSSCIYKPTCRRPSSVFFANRFRSADCQKIQLPPGGSQELRSFWQFPFNEPLCCVCFTNSKIFTNPIQPTAPLRWRCIYKTSSAKERHHHEKNACSAADPGAAAHRLCISDGGAHPDRKSTRLNSSH